MAHRIFHCYCIVCEEDFVADKPFLSVCRDCRADLRKHPLKRIEIERDPRNLEN